ncbi:MAG: hypothetical protein FK732_00440, partial [Asgard group archaeon]|nr:hypothetical protein [Asgard group archaeon]
MSFFKRIFAKKTKEIGEEIKKPAVIERMTAPDKIRASETLRIVVSGHFSNLGWSLDKAEAHIQNKDIIIS